jgi:hypothetical protein
VSELSQFSDRLVTEPDQKEAPPKNLPYRLTDDFKAWEEFCKQNNITKAYKDKIPQSTSGNKYHRQIRLLKAYSPDTPTIDVYSVLTAFAVVSPGLQHAVKKLLCAGLRGKGSALQDLKEARDALDRAIDDAEHES